jgi:ERO1-like protein alpha
VQNLYFAYLFVLRAVMKAAPLLTSYDYNTGLPEEDAYTRQLITQLVSAVSWFGLPSQNLKPDEG